jgi:hypothetical protein
VLVVEDGVAGPSGISSGDLLQRGGPGFDDEVVDRDLVDRLAFLHRGGVVDLLAGIEQRVDLAVQRQVEMRDGLLGLGEAGGDDLAHAVVGHDLVAAFFVESEHLLLGHTLGHRTCGSGRRGGGGLERRLAGGSGFDVRLHDAAARA